MEKLITPVVQVIDCGLNYVCGGGLRGQDRISYQEKSTKIVGKIAIF